MNPLQLILSALAEDDLKSIWRWTSEHFDEAQADAYLESIGRRLEALATAPLAGTDQGSIRDGYRSWVVGRHTAFYKLDEGAVIIQRVLHGGMDPEIHLDN